VTDTLTEEEYQHPQDEPPKAKRPRGRPRTKKGAHSIGAGRNAQPLKVQLQVPYQLLGQVVGARGLPATGNALIVAAPRAAEAWDQFLQRWPGLYEMLEKGMIASDVIVLVMIHLEILGVARQEMAQRAQYLTGQGPSGDDSNPAHAQQPIT
jgi:hypothetical protein